MLNEKALLHNTPENVNRLFSDQGYVNRYLSDERLAWYGEMIDLFVDETGINLRDKQIADVGCGTGHALKYIYENFKEGSGLLHLYGYDYSSVVLDIARKTLLNATFILHDLNDPLPMKFDIILALEVFEHLCNPQVVLDNLRLALRDDGLIFTTIPDGATNGFFGHIHKWKFDEWLEFSGAVMAGISRTVRSRTANPVIWSIIEKEP